MARRHIGCLFAASEVFQNRAILFDSIGHSSRILILIRNGYEMLTVKILAVKIRITVFLRSSKISQFPNPSKHITSLNFLATIQTLILAFPIDNKLNTLTVAIGIRLSIDRLDHIFPSRCLRRFQPFHKIVIHECFILIHGCDIACKIHVAASAIDGKCSAIELETCFILDIDIAARRFDSTIVLTGVRAAKERCAICARRQ